MLFSHPKDFTPVCTTELGRGGRAQARVRQAQRQGDRPVGRPASTDHEGWAQDIEETQGAELNFPLIADPDQKVADLYDMIHPNASDTITVRSVFVIGPDNKVKLTLTYPAVTGRNFDELLRVIDSLQLTAKHKVATPADWKQGEDVIIVPAVSDEEAKEQFPDGLGRQEALPAGRQAAGLTAGAADGPERPLAPTSVRTAGAVEPGPLSCGPCGRTDRRVNRSPGHRRRHRARHARSTARATPR